MPGRGHSIRNSLQLAVRQLHGPHLDAKIIIITVMKAHYKAPNLFEAGSGRSIGHGGERCGGPHALP